MTTIHVQRIGTSPGYKAWIHGQHDWCYGFGHTWKEAVGDLLHTFEATLGLGLHVAPELEPVVLDGLAAGNACGGCEACQTDLAEVHRKLDAFLEDSSEDHADHPEYNAELPAPSDVEMAERAADWNQVP